ncbi:hypothetical protein GLOIN_2v1491865, partial [Rhizophagus irregularis DAOM 181602=DAOM 197198]
TTLLLHPDTTIYSLVLMILFSTTILYKQHLLLMILYRIYLHFIMTLKILGPFLRLIKNIFFLQNTKSST